jgi:hypothetical protein
VASRKVAKILDKEGYILDQVSKYQSRNEVLEEIVSKGEPIKTTSIGRTQWDVRTCTCGVKARTDRDHAEECPVLPVTDSGPVITAIKELRMNNMYLDSLVKGLQHPDQTEDVIAGMAEYREIRYREVEHVKEIERLTGEVDSLRSQLARWESGDYAVAELTA